MCVLCVSGPPQPGNPANPAYPPGYNPAYPGQPAQGSFPQPGHYPAGMNPAMVPNPSPGTMPYGAPGTHPNPMGPGGCQIGLHDFKKIINVFDLDWYFNCKMLCDIRRNDPVHPLFLFSLKNMLK